MKRKYWVLLVVCGWVLFVDQWTKVAVQQRLHLYQRVPVIEGFFNLTHVRNTGGAFGILSGRKGAAGGYFFLGFTFAAIGVIVFLYVKLKDGDRHLALALSLVLSGAMGNLIDRLRNGEVIDFLEFYVSSFRWPAFNIADSAICLGIGLMAWELLKKDHSRSPQSKRSIPR